MQSTCKATTRAGRPCGGTARASGFCWFHDPALADQRAAGRRLGGSARSNRSRARRQLMDAAMSPAEIGGLLSMTLTKVIAGQTEPGVGNAAANLGKAIVAVQQAAEIEQRLEALEQALGQTERGGRVA